MNHNAPFTLTIVVACHDRPALAEKAIESVLRQTNQIFALVVSDNSTTPDVEDLVARRFPFVTYVKRPECAPCEHGNLIIADCLTSHLMIMHDDDELEESYVEEMRAFIEANPSCSCYASNGVKIDLEGNVVSPRFYISTKAQDGSRDRDWLIRRWFSYGSFAVAPLPSYIYDVSAIRGIEFNSKLYGQMNDFVFIDQCVMRAGGLAWLNRPLYRYRLHTMQDSQRITFASWRKLSAYLKRHHKRYYRSSEFGLYRVRCLSNLLPPSKRAARMHLKKAALLLLVRNPRVMMRRAVILGLQVSDRLF